MRKILLGPRFVALSAVAVAPSSVVHALSMLIVTG
jgi:hypothetical protein